MTAIHTLFHYFVHSLRVLRKTPGTTFLAIAALGLGIGLTTTMFSLVQGLLLRSLPFDHAGRVMYVGALFDQRYIKPVVSLHDYFDFRAAQSSFDPFVAYSNRKVSLSEDEGFPERHSACFASHGFFASLPVEAIHGRVFGAEDDVPGAPRVAVVGYRLWQNRFEGDPNVLGRRIRIDGETVEIVGVMPADFEFPLIEEIWMPLQADLGKWQRGQGPKVRLFGLLRPGTSREAAEKDMQAIAARLAEQYPETNKDVGAFVQEFVEKHMWKDLRLTLYSALALIFLGHLIACTNVASLLMARAIRRGHEMAVMTALGARRRQVMGYLLAESLLLSFVGAVIGLGLAWLGVTYIADAFAWMPLPFWSEFSLDLRGLGVAAGLTTLTALLAGLPPAFLSSRGDVSDLLGDSRSGTALKLGRLIPVLVVVEIAAAAMLVICTGLIARTLVNLEDLELNVDVDKIYTAGLTLGPGTYPGPTEVGTFVDQFLSRLEAHPDVLTLGAASSLPADGVYNFALFAVEGETYSGLADYPKAHRVVATPSFFDVFRLAAVEGRLFDERDRLDGLPVAVVNRSFVETAWPGEDPIGKRLRLVKTDTTDGDQPWRRVIGVVPDFWPGMYNDEYQGGIYLPQAQSNNRSLLLVAEARGSAASLATPFRETARSLDPILAFSDQLPFAEVLDRGMFFSRLFGDLIVALGFVAMLFAALGIYGVNAFSVEQRTREIGVRMALGARRTQVFALILKEAGRRLLLGLAFGLVGAFFATRYLRWVLFEVDPRDPVTFAGTVLFLTVVSLVACFAPARRASTIDPLTALRYQ